MDIQKLWEEHALNRLLFEKACRSDDISQEEYNIIRERYNASLRAYHDALGYGTHSPASPRTEAGMDSTT